ncbi:MAG: maleylpyruvate isomerase N-terminal domain-containing protein, partial [Acidimicrobiales bacterium]
MDASDYPAIADRFGAVVDSVNDWDAPTPVPEWRARDIVDHLTTWLPGLLGSCGVEIPMGTL